METIKELSRNSPEPERQITYVEIDGVRCRKELIRQYDDDGFLIMERELLTRVDSGRRVSWRSEKFGFRGSVVLESVFVEYGNLGQETLRELVEHKYDRQWRLKKSKYSRFLFGVKEAEITAGYESGSGHLLELTRSSYENGEKVDEESRQFDPKEEDIGVEDKGLDSAQSPEGAEIEEVDGYGPATGHSGPKPQLLATEPADQPPSASLSTDRPQSSIKRTITPLIFIKYWSDKPPKPPDKDPELLPIVPPLPRLDTPKASTRVEARRSGEAEESKQTPKEEIKKPDQAVSPKMAAVERQLAAAMFAPPLKKRSLEQSGPDNKTPPASEDRQAKPSKAVDKELNDSPPGSPKESGSRENKEAPEQEKNNTPKDPADRQPAISPIAPTGIGDYRLPPDQQPKPELPGSDGSSDGQSDSKLKKSVWITVATVVAILFALLLYLLID